MIKPQQIPPPRRGVVSDEDVCRYIAEICFELRHMARRPRLRMVGYLLDMARLEAERALDADRNRR